MLSIHCKQGSTKYISLSLESGFLTFSCGGRACANQGGYGLLLFLHLDGLLLLLRLDGLLLLLLDGLLLRPDDRSSEALTPIWTEGRGSQSDQDELREIKINVPFCLFGDVWRKC